MATRKIAVLVGSLRKESYNRKLAKRLMLAAPPTLELEIVEIGHLPLYNQDDETKPPPADLDRIPRAHREARRRPVLHAGIQPFRAGRAEERDRRRLATVRPERVDGKPCARRQRLAGRDRRLRRQPPPAPVARVPQHAGMQPPEAYIGSVGGKFDGDQLTDEGLKTFLQQFMDCFATWVERHAD